MASLDDLFDKGKKEEQPKPEQSTTPAVEEKSQEEPAKEAPKIKQQEVSKDKVSDLFSTDTSTPKATTQKEKGNEEFDLRPQEDTIGKEVYCFFGLKGGGKTMLAFSFVNLDDTSKIACLSFDNKSKIVHQQDFNNNPRIVVWNAVAYEDSSSPEAILESSDRTFRFINKLLDEIKTKGFDWIVIDGVEDLQKICEMTMRYRNNIMPFQGIANLNLWKERRMYIRQVHHKALEAVKKGVIYSTYSDKDEVVIEGEVLTKKDIPKWVDAIMTETDVVVKVYAQHNQGTKTFYASVESSKYKKIPTGQLVNITDKGIKALIKEKTA